MHGKLKQTLIAAGLIALVSSPVLAGKDDGHHHKKGGYWEHLDTNDDGLVTREEFMEHAEQRFSKMDENGDGAISKEEFQKMRKMHKEKIKKQHKHKKKMRMED